jgi:hypothetical protein
MRTKNAEFDADFESVEKVVIKIPPKNCYLRERVGIMHLLFHFFITVRKSSQPSNFLHVNTFATFSMNSNSASNF